MESTVIFELSTVYSKPRFVHSMPYVQAEMNIGLFL